MRTPPRRWLLATIIPIALLSLVSTLCLFAWALLTFLVLVAYKSMMGQNTIFSHAVMFGLGMGWFGWVCLARLVWQSLTKPAPLPVWVLMGLPMGFVLNAGLAGFMLIGRSPQPTMFVAALCTPLVLATACLVLNQRDLAKHTVANAQ